MPSRKKRMATITTIEDAREFVKKVKICTIFPSAKTRHPSLYAHVDLPEKRPGDAGWGERMEAVWPWKNRLPLDYPSEIYYGKIKGGFAVLMDMSYLEETHFPEAHRPVSALSQLARWIHEKIRVEPWTTTDLRNEIIRERGCSRSQFDNALKDLQISLNVVRALDSEQDTWVTFQEVYPDIWNKYVCQPGRLRHDSARPAM